MPINVGEVNATLRLNVAQEQLAEARARLEELQKQFAAAGGSATEAGRAIYASGVQQAQVVKQAEQAVAQWTASLATLRGQLPPTTVAVNNLGGAAAACAAAAQAAAPAIASVTAAAAPAAAAIAAVQAQAAPAAAGLANVQQAATAATSGFNQMESMAARMVQRLVILYALHESFTFVKGIFTGAEAMEALSERTGVSIGKLQEFQIAGKNAGAPVHDLDQAIINLQKNLVQFKGGDALHELGLSFEQVFAMKPDQQIDAIMKALQGIVSPAQRAKLEIELFGSDAIDPLVQKYEALTESARKTGAVMDDMTVHSLADADRAFRRTTDALEIYAAKGLVFAQRIVAEVFTPIMLATDGDARAQREWAHHVMGSMQDVANEAKVTRTAVEKPAGPLLGQAFIDSLRVEVQLTAEQKSKLLELNDIHDLTAANAMRAANVTSDQYRVFIKELQETNKEAKEAETKAAALARAWEEVNSAGEDLKGTVAGLTEEQNKGIEAGLKAGVSQHALALAYEATATQVRAKAKEISNLEVAHKKAETAAHHAAEVERKAEIDAEANWEQYYDAVESMSGTARDKQIAAVDTWLARKIAAAEKAGIVDQDYYNSLEAIASAKIDAIIQKNNELYKFSREHYENAAQVAKDQLDEVLKHAGDYTGKEIKLAIQMYTEKLKESARWRTQANKDVDEHYNHEMKKAREAADEVMLLSGEVVKKVEADRRRLAGGSFTYDMSTKEGMDQFHKLNPAATSQWSDTQIQEFAKKGGTLQQLIEKSIINLYGGYMPAGNLPHFAGGVNNFSGGMAVVGERGPETVYLPQGASVAPLAPVGGTGGTVTQHNIIYVNGTAADVARKVSEELMKSLKLNRRFGAA